MNDDENRRNEQLLLEDEERRIAIANRNAVVARLVQMIYYLNGALAVLLLLRFVLHLSGANPDNQVAQVIQNLSNPFVYPFSNLFGKPVLGKSEVFDTNALVAILAYTILAWLVGRFVWLVGSRTR